MKQILTTTIVVVLLVGIGEAKGLAGPNTPSTEIISINQLEWLTGSWQGPIDGGILEETWLPPRANTITALVRLTKDDVTEFVELIKIEKVGSSLELRLQIFDSSLKPRWEKPHVFRLSKIEKNSISFRGVSKDSHRKLSYERVSSNHFVIRIQTNQGSDIEINLSPSKEIKHGAKKGQELKNKDLE